MEKTTYNWDYIFAIISLVIIILIMCLALGGIASSERAALAEVEKHQEEIVDLQSKNSSLVIKNKIANYAIKKFAEITSETIVIDLNEVLDLDTLIMGRGNHNED